MRQNESSKSDDVVGEDELAVCLNVLKRLREDPQQCLHVESPAASVISRAAELLRAVKSFQKRQERLRDRELVDETSIRRHRGQRQAAVETDSPAPLPHAPQAESRIELCQARRCYICKQPFSRLHAFYDALCPSCAELNQTKRRQSADLQGRRAMITGGRIKIGFEISLKLLRAGAELVVTTRFPHDAAKRFSEQPDFENWRERLRIYGLDFRDLPGLEQFAAGAAADFGSLDILINNAAQTIRRPPAFYRHLLQNESRQRKALKKSQRRLIAAAPDLPIESPSDSEVRTSAAGVLHLSAAQSQLPISTADAEHDSADFPEGRLDEHGQQVDLRGHNSWVHGLTDVSTAELLEVHAVNCLAPYILLRELTPLFERSPNPDRYVVNVSAMEGRFESFKTGFHPHTNMAKAALNMITRTCAEEYSANGVYMNSVDTGWVTNEFPAPKTATMQRNGFQPPLDEIDGAARVCDPIFAGVNSGAHVFGKFLKDYREISW